MTTEDLTVPTPQPSRRRALLAGAGLLGVAGLVGGMLLLAGPPSAVDPVPVTAARSTGSDVVVQPVHRTTSPEVNLEVPEGRNPFEPGYLPPLDAAAAPAGDVATDVGGVGPTGAVAVPAEDTPTTGDTPLTDRPVIDDGKDAGGSSGTPAPTEETRDTYPLRLVAISEPAPQVRRVVFEVDGVPVDVIPGQRFGVYGELVVLAFAEPEGGGPVEVLLQVGDATPEQMAVGETKDVL